MNQTMHALHQEYINESRLVDRACYNMRCGGYTYRQIGSQLGFSPARAHQRVRRHIIREAHRG